MVSMILFTEVDMKIIGAENISDLFGFSAEECQNNHFSRLLAPTYRELCQQLVWECLLNKKPMLVEGQHKNETKFPITLLVTEQDMLGQAVLIASIFSVHIEYGLISVVKSGTIIAANSRAEKIFERPGSELRDKHIKTLIPSLGPEGSLSRGFSKQVLGLGSSGKELSLWVSVDADSPTFGELIHAKVEDLTPDMEAECVLEMDSTMSIVGCSRYFVYPLLGFLNYELIGQNVHTLIDAKDIDSKVTFPERGEEEGQARKRMKVAPPLEVTIVPTSTRVLVRNKSGFSSPFNMHVSPYNAVTDRFSIHLKLAQTSLTKPPDEVIRMLSDYSFQYQVDNGECSSSTSVFSAVQKSTNETHAIKIVNKRLIDANLKQRLIVEYKIASSLNHVNIIRFFNQLETENYLCTIMEFGRDGSLESYVRKFTKLPEPEARRLFRDMTAGLSFMHSSKCVHGDIKLNNAVMIDGVAKLIDFNMSKRMDEENLEPSAKRTTFCGTSLYIAPEMVLNKDYDGQKADIWSLGVCLYVMLIGDYPFDSIAASLQQRLNIPPHISAPCVELLKSILMFSPIKRFYTAQILAHPWMQEPAKEPAVEPPAPLPPSNSDAVRSPSSNLSSNSGSMLPLSTSSSGSALESSTLPIVDTTSPISNDSSLVPPASCNPLSTDSQLEPKTTTTPASTPIVPSTSTAPANTNPTNLENGNHLPQPVS